jgi:hypothetical protein
MKAARLHAYRDALKLDSIDEPTVDGPLDVIVRIAPIRWTPSTTRWPTSMTGACRAAGS